MGVQHLWGILDPVKQVVPLETLSGKHLCIDLSFWICELNLPHANPRDKPYLRGLFHRLRALLALDCRITLVADGAVPAIKLPAYHQRLENLSHPPPLPPVPIRENASSGRRHKSSEFGRMVEEAKAMGRAMGCAIITSMEEAEAQCAMLNAAGICDVCCTGDSDAFLFGARLVMRHCVLHPSCGRSTATLYSADEIQQQLHFGRNSMIALGLLLGSDYSPKFRGVSVSTALKAVAAAGDERVLPQVVEGGVRQMAAKGKLKPPSKTRQRKGKEGAGKPLYNAPPLPLPLPVVGLESDEEQLAQQCLTAYLHPTCHPVSAPIIQTALAGAGCVHTADLVMLMEEQVGWGGEVTEGYLRPKLAERDLRRAAGGQPRSGVGMYSVGGIVKCRVVYGRECYEVEWVGGGGGHSPITPSVVAADLVQAAYPRVVEEYWKEKEKKKEKKGKAGKEKKGKGRAGVGEILEVGSGLGLGVGVGLGLGVEDVCSQFEGLRVMLPPSDPLFSRLRQESGWGVGGKVVVDLGSPSPILPRNASRMCKQNQVEGGTVDDSDSDVECVDASTFHIARLLRGTGEERRGGWR